MRPPIQSALSGSNSTRKYDRIAAAVRALYIYNRLSAALLLCTVYIKKEAREGETYIALLLGRADQGDKIMIHAPRRENIG
jgi:predicted deacetylase